MSSSSAPGMPGVAAGVLRYVGGGVVQGLSHEVDHGGGVSGLVLCGHGWRSSSVGLEGIMGMRGRGGMAAGGSGWFLHCEERGGGRPGFGHVGAEFRWRQFSVVEMPVEAVGYSEPGAPGVATLRAVQVPGGCMEGAVAVVGQPTDWATATRQWTKAPHKNPAAIYPLPPGWNSLSARARRRRAASRCSSWFMRGRPGGRPAGWPSPWRRWRRGNRRPPHVPGIPIRCRT